MKLTQRRLALLAVAISVICLGVAVLFSVHVGSPQLFYRSALRQVIDAAEKKKEHRVIQETAEKGMAQAVAYEAAEERDGQRALGAALLGVIVPMAALLYIAAKGKRANKES